MSEFDPALEERVAEALCNLTEVCEVCRKKARAVLTAVADDLRAEAWDEGWYVRCHTLSAKNPYSGRKVDQYVGPERSYRAEAGERSCCDARIGEPHQAMCPRGST